MKNITVKVTTNLVDSILKSAGDRFRHYGYKKTTVNEIAADVRISKKTLYAVYPSKEEIARETAWREMVDIIKQFNETVPPKTSTDKMLLSLCKFIFTDRIKKGQDGLFHGLYLEEYALREAYMKSLTRVFVAVYEDGLKRGLLKRIDPVFAAETIINIVITAADYFPRSEQPVIIFDSALAMIADAVAFKDRIKFDAMG
ncbi:TetR/AcrR family transcriptional regulator [Candidatus Latescibacterota bacterium]